MLVSLILFKIKKCTRRCALVSFVIAGLLLVTVIAFDRYNLLVNYEIWTERGMPDFGHKVTD